MCRVFQIIDRSGSELNLWFLENCSRRADALFPPSIKIGQGVTLGLIESGLPVLWKRRGFPWSVSDKSAAQLTAEATRGVVEILSQTLQHPSPAALSVFAKIVRWWRWLVWGLCWGTFWRAGNQVWHEENVQIWPMLIKPMEANKVLKYAEEISFKSLHRFCFAFVCAQGWVSRLKFCFYGAWKSP